MCFATAPLLRNGEIMTNKERVKKDIINGNVYLGIELGSTRIKSVLINSAHKPIATGGLELESKLIDDLWIYDIDAAWTGIQSSFKELKGQVREKYGLPLCKIASIGISAMMHGYLVFDQNHHQLAPFLTWRNTNAKNAAEILSKEFSFNVPMRWSIAQLYQSILDDSPHIKDITYLTTLSAYVHWKLSGQKIIGICDASGISPIDPKTCNYDSTMLEKFDDLIAHKAYPWKIKDILPKVRLAGEEAGELSREGALLLDPSGQLESGIKLCPPEGDAATGMVATNSVAINTGNLSMGTSSFAMLVLEGEFKEIDKDIDVISTPSGATVAMVHTNNCTTDLDAWINLFKDVLESFGTQVDKSSLYRTLYNKALEAELDCGKLLSYNFVAGEPITGINESGRPLFLRAGGSNFTLPNFMRTNLFFMIAPLRIGFDILKDKGVEITQITAHGGFFKTPEVGQRFLAAALGVPVRVTETAGEGGAWGIALLAAYNISKKENEQLPEYLESNVFVKGTEGCLYPVKEDVLSFNLFLERYKKALEVEQKAIELS